MKGRKKKKGEKEFNLFTTTTKKIKAWRADTASCQGPTAIKLRH